MEPHADSSRPDNAGSGPPPARGGLSLGRILGFPVYINASWLLIAALVTFTYGQVVQSGRPQLSTPAAYGIGFGFVLCLLLSVLLHELGHALASRRFGIGVRAITLEMLGGYTEMDREAPRPQVELVIALAGPAVSLVIGVASAIAAAVLPERTILYELAFQLAISNIIVAAFNALPGLPLDGGQALRAVVWAIRRDRYAGTRVAGWAGRVVAVLSLATAVLLYGTGIFSTFGLLFSALIALTLWTGAGQAIRLGQVGARLTLVDLTRLTRPIFSVPVGTPLAEARRRAELAGAGHAALAVTDTSGRLVALVNEPAAMAVPEARRPWVTVDTVSRAIDPHHTMPAHLTGEDVLRLVQAHPAPEYLVTAGQDVIGVLRVADLSQLLDPKSSGSARTRQRTTR